MLLIAAQHTAAQAIPSSSGRSSLVTYALHTRVMVLSMHHHIATQTVATTVATRAQRAIDERFCLRQWILLYETDNIQVRRLGFLPSLLQPIAALLFASRISLDWWSSE
ncbi:uncharacterized protein FPRN_07675 [Fusarium proliferatum]|nr:uncharacterized protein FPRN_07675 [Fusarium proliferatum]